MTEPTLRTSAEMLDRMESLIRRLADSYEKEELYGGWAWRDEAKAIVAMLPEPVDPDIQLSRNIAADAKAKTGTGVDYCDYMRSGEYDHDSVRIAAFDGIKRGRELASA